MSPTIGTGGLTSAHREQWKKVWQSSQYDPDLIVSMTYGGGDLHSFDGYLWWGTMHLPGLATILFTSLHELGIVDHDTNGNGQIDGGNTGEAAVLQLGTNRFTSVHRGKYFGTKNQVVQVVYGNQHLPIYDRAAKSYTYAADAAHQNLTGPPVHGLAGFGTSSFYTWTMEVFGYSLYIGTFTLPLGNQFPNNPIGADLWRIDSKDDLAVVESLEAGDRSTWGIRSIAALAGKLFLGTAGPVNLDRTHINPAFPKPGYQLIEGVPAP
jgi:hypothetical protein